MPTFENQAENTTQETEANALQRNNKCQFWSSLVRMQSIKNEKEQGEEQHNSLKQGSRHGARTHILKNNKIKPKTKTNKERKRAGKNVLVHSESRRRGENKTTGRRNRQNRDQLATAETGKLCLSLGVAEKIRGLQVKNRSDTK